LDTFLQGNPGRAAHLAVWQRKILLPQLLEAHSLFCEAEEELELLYYQRKSSRLHFCQQSLHALVHTVSEIIRTSPGEYRSQWTMERTMGNLGGGDSAAFQPICQPVSVRQAPVPIQRTQNLNPNP
jgi:hypothetical protein